MRTLWFIPFLVSFPLMGCGYTSKSLLPQNVNSVYVPIFDNKTFRRGLEFDLTNAIKNEILFKTRLKLADKDHADSALYGKIRDVRGHVLIENPDAQVVETAVTIFVEFSWVDLRTGRTIVNKMGVTQQGEFKATRQEDEKFAEDKAFVDLAERIVNLMEEAW